MRVCAGKSHRKLAQKNKKIICSRIEQQLARIAKRRNLRQTDVNLIEEAL